MSGQQRIIMNFSTPPTVDDLQDIAGEVIQSLPDELVDFADGLAVQIEDMPDELTEQEQDIDDPYELTALYRSGKEISPGVEKKAANDEDILTLYRRSILDLWCEMGEDLGILVRQVIVEEVGRQFDFSDDEIDEMVQRHHQGLL